jgi:hypothetical protein
LSFISFDHGIALLWCTCTGFYCSFGIFNFFLIMLGTIVL